MNDILSERYAEYEKGYLRLDWQEGEQNHPSMQRNLKRQVEQMDVS